jgi:hypothetical protein
VNDDETPEPVPLPNEPPYAWEAEVECPDCDISWPFAAMACPSCGLTIVQIAERFTRPGQA